MYTSGVLSSAYCGTMLDHGVLVVGWGVEESSDGKPAEEYWYELVTQSKMTTSCTTAAQSTSSIYKCVLLAQEDTSAAPSATCRLVLCSSPSGLSVNLSLSLSLFVCACVRMCEHSQVSRSPQFCKVMEVYLVFRRSRMCSQDSAAAALVRPGPATAAVDLQGPVVEEVPLAMEVRD